MKLAMPDSRQTDRPSCEKTLISVVLPVYNEAQALPILTARIAEALDAGLARYEIVLVNDGSTDESPRILDQLAASSDRIRVVHLSRNFGRQAAVQAGLAHAGGDAVVLMDSDMQDAPEAIPRFIAAWRAGYDVVYAIRAGRKESLLVRLLCSAFNRLLSAVASVPMSAETGVFGLIDRRVAQKIIHLFESDGYFPGLRAWVGLQQTGIEVERNAQQDRRPWTTLRELLRLTKTAMFSFSSFPLTIFHAIGVAAAAVFAGLGAFSIFCKLFTDLAVPGWTSLILVGSFFGALNALGISILGKYVVRIYNQVRGRPQYVVDRTVNFAPAVKPDDTAGDVPYVALLEETMDLIKHGTVYEDSRNRELIALGP
jgi:polyisoprenyl-phosphate glycosyltransferase